MPAEILRVPIIDISALFSPEENGQGKNKTIKEIGDACRDWGFFYVVGHNVKSELIKNFIEQSFKFFNMPSEFKKKIHRTSDNFRGYYDQELTKQKVDWKEVFDFGSEIVIDDKGYQIDGANRWPEAMSEFKNTLMDYFEGVYTLSQELMKATFTSLNVKPEDLDMESKGSYETSYCRLNMYPLCPDPKKHLGVSPHTDPGSVTVLLQDNKVSSLQVERNGKFYDIPPVPDSFVINIGDMTQVWSNDLYKAPVHRVLANTKIQRFSSAMFRLLSYDTVIQPLKGCVTEENPQKYRTFTYGEFWKGRVEGNYANVGEEIQISDFKVDK